MCDVTFSPKSWENCYVTVHDYWMRFVDHNFSFGVRHRPNILLNEYRRISKVTGAATFRISGLSGWIHYEGRLLSVGGLFVVTSFSIGKVFCPFYLKHYFPHSTSEIVFYRFELLDNNFHLCLSACLSPGYLKMYCTHFHENLWKGWLNLVENWLKKL